MSTKRPGPAPGKGAKVSLKNVYECYGEDPPAWIIELAQACDKSSQTVVAKKIGYSAPVLSQLFKNVYTGDIAKLKQIVEGLLMNEEVFCPVLGNMKKDICLDHQKRAHLAPTSSFAQIMANACPGCPISNLGGKDE